MLLTPLQTRELFWEALEERFAVLAVNADSPAAIVDVLEAARLCDAPVIIETSLWQLTGHSFGFGDPILGLRQYLSYLGTLAQSERYAPLRIAFHTDHIKGPRTLEILTEAQRLGASSLSLDSSELTEEQNLALARQLCGLSESLTLELEAGVDDGLTALEVTDRIVSGIEQTHPGRLALWAPGCGTRHGLSQDGFPEFSPTHVAAHQQRASELAGRPIGIALHGSSGLSEDALRLAVKAGVVKVNWSSESLLLRSQAARAYYAEFGGQLEGGAPDFKKAAMDNGLQNYVSKSYIPRLVSRLKLLQKPVDSSSMQEQEGR
jgi:fructose-bisphosphate aldolase, class II